MHIVQFFHLLGILLFDSHIKAVEQIQLSVSITKKSGVQGIIKGRYHFINIAKNYGN